MRFQLPVGISADAVRELDRTCVAGGPDNMPWPTQLRITPTELAATRTVDESGYLVVPWKVEGAGRLIGTTATLMERPAAYNLLIELARGKVNQLRSQAADWRTGGLQIGPELQGHIDAASLAFVKAIAAGDDRSVPELATTALAQAYRASDALVHAYVDQVFHIRHQRQPQLESHLGCRLGTAVPTGAARDALLASCNAVCLPLYWNAIETEEGSYDWAATDALVEWAKKSGTALSAGPLLDFSSAFLPAWLWLWERDLPSLASFMCKYVETAVRRYKGVVRRWQLTAASNCSSVLSLGEDELLSLTYRLVDAARQVDPSLELMVGVSQPWGEYMAVEDRTHSPFIFADTLIRSGLNLAGLDVEVVMGVTPRGSYCRDLLETSRLLDLYAVLTVPLRVTLAYPSAEKADPDANPELRVAAGRWRDGFSSAAQADWAYAFAALALCKPFVQSVQWAQFSDAEVHPFPHCGLVEATGELKPALARLAELRRAHLS
jgi:hypothetical protein